MDNEGSTLGAVSVHYDDYLGSAAADDADAMGATRSLYQMVGLDRDQWLIVSVELARSRQADRVSVYAIDRLQHGVGTRDDVEDLAEAIGSLPVVAFDLPSTVSVTDFIEEAFQRLTIRLMAHGVGAQSLNVVGRQRLSADAI